MLARFFNFFFATTSAINDNCNEQRVGGLEKEGQG